MKLDFPSYEFDSAVSAVCHGQASDEQLHALNELLRSNATARDEYIVRLEIHSRLASDPDLFTSQDSEFSNTSGPSADTLQPTLLLASAQRDRRKPLLWALALAACLGLVTFGIWSRRPVPTGTPSEPTSMAIAMLNRTADARWDTASAIPRLNAPLEPGPLRLESGLAQVVFYSGARMVIEGPAELELVSANEVRCRRGRMVANVPAQAHGFRIDTPQIGMIDLGTSFGLNVSDGQTAVHVFKGNVKLSSTSGNPDQKLGQGMGARIGRDQEVLRFPAETSLFESLFEFQAKSQAAEARRFDQWRTTCKRLQTDRSLLLHFNFENIPPNGWQIPNLGSPAAGVSDATIVGCEWTQGRWPEKRALEFQSVNDRVRLAVPGSFEALTLSAWVCVKGLDRKINSLFMSDGFEPGTVHWLIRRDGVLGLTVIGGDPGEYQIITSPPVITLEKFGMWLHLAVVLDGGARRAIHYLNGVPVSETKLGIAPPFRVAAAELGNWNAKGFPKDDPFMIRNFSGAMDEFFIFNRALDDDEIRTLYAQAKPQGDTSVE
ncbi:MAG: LamG-like jellyroll fold domain-containing protein [Verrucomicrobiota bacterium]